MITIQLTCILLVMVACAVVECGTLKQLFVSPEMREMWKNDEKNSEVVLSRKKRWEFQTFRVMENEAGPKTVARLHSSFDNNTGDVKYSIKGKGANSLFVINEDTGELIVQHALDREGQAAYQLTVYAKNLNGREVENPSEITISVEDKNDNSPIFPSSHYSAFVKERSKIGESVTFVKAHDEDDPEGSYGQIQYRLLPSNGSSKFIIISDTGEVKTAVANLDRESVDHYELIIEARDDPYAKLGNHIKTNLTVTLRDVNDNPPVFINKPYNPSIPEDLDIGAEVTRVETQDADLHENAMSEYSIMSGDISKFSIETINNKGVIKVKEPLDYETARNHQYKLRIKVKNIAPPGPNYVGQLEDETDVIIRLTDVNELPIFYDTSYKFSVPENAIPGFPIRKVEAFDPEADLFLYSLDDKSGKFAIGPSSGMISVAGKLDRETKSNYVVFAKAGSPDEASVVKVVIEIEDVNDHPPTPLEGDKLELIWCKNNQEKTQALQPNIEMTDLDDAHLNGAPFHYYETKDPVYSRHFQLVDNRDSTATLHTLHNDFNSISVEEYRVPFVVQDSGKPPLNATYHLTVRLCYCPNGEPLCSAAAQDAGIPLAVIIILLCAFVILLIIVIIFITARRKRNRRDQALLKVSVSTCEDVAREDIVNYNEEGGGEEDTAAFDLGALQKDCCSSSTGSPTKDRLKFPTPPSTNVTMSPPLKFTSPRSLNNSDDIKDFIVKRKFVEDKDDMKLAFDSLQVYTYEGDGSEAGSLSSICSDSFGEEQDYDYLQQWGPRFKRLSDMYGSGCNYQDDDLENDDSVSLLSSQLGRTNS